MAPIWIVTASNARTRIFEASTPRGPLTEVKDLAHPEARLREQDLVTDDEGMGRDRGSQGGRHGVSGSPASEQSAQAFARESASCLEQALRDDCFGHLLLCAEPRHLGRLRKALPQSVSDRIVTEIDKDYTGIDDPRELLQRLPDPLHRPAVM
jgi:protein required for attachment to host cells